MKRLLSLALCALMLLALCGCNSSSSQAPTEGTTAPTETTAPPPPTPEEVYADAIGHLEDLDAMVLEISSKTTMTLGNDTFLDSTSQTLTLQGIGSDSFAAALDQSTSQGTYTTDLTEYYSDGTLYMTFADNDYVDATSYTAPISYEAFMDRFTPAIVLDAALYETVEQPAPKSLRFSDATALEGWLDSDGMELIEASGSVVLNDDGTINRSTYDVSFTYGPAQYDMELSVNIIPDSGEAIAAPTETDDYIELEDYRIPMLLEQTIGLALQMNSVSLTSTITDFIQATGLTNIAINQHHIYGQGAEMVADLNFDLSVTEGDETYAQTENLHYVDGVATYSFNGEEPEEDGSTPVYLSSLVQAEIAGFLPDRNHIESYTLTDLPAFVLLEYTIALDKGQTQAEAMMDEFYDDPKGLTELASDYTTEYTRGYIGIEKSTGLPVSISNEYRGYYIIEDQIYPMVHNAQLTLTVGHPDTYAAITGEPLPAESAETPTPLFYKVTGADGQQMWLLGTIHVGDARTENLPEAITTALTEADALAVEFDSDAYLANLEDDPKAMAAYLTAFLYTDGTSLKDHIEDQELYDYTIATLKATGNYNSTSLVTKPIMLAQTVDHVNMSWGYRLSSDYGVDNQLMELAREAGVEIRDVESGEFQMDMLANYSDPLQELLLKSSVYTDHLSYNTSVNELFELWCAGDEAALIEQINDEDTSEMTEEEIALMEEYNKAMSDDRNVGMLDVAVSYLESDDVVFYAVGLAHLLAEDGLVNTLRDAGYTVELVPVA